jgi:hypothetical protein
MRYALGKLLSDYFRKYSQKSFANTKCITQDNFFLNIYIEYNGKEAIYVTSILCDVICAAEN